MSNFANNLRIIRNNKKISQEEIAEAIGRSPSAIAFWEKGRSEPNADDLKAIAEFLNVSIDLLVNNEMELTQLVYKKETIFEIEKTINSIIAQLKTLSELLKLPQNDNIVNYQDTGKQRVPKKQFRNQQNISNVSDSLIMQDNHGKVYYKTDEDNKKKEK